MSLVVAGISGSKIWMVSDAAVTGGTVEPRRREYLPKIEPSPAAVALVAFAGDVHHGSRLARLAAAERSNQDAIQMLIDGTQTYPVEFAYGYFEGGTPKLARIADGNAEQVFALHLGISSAFETFQKIRHGELDPYAPKALKSLMCGTPEDEVPEPLGQAIGAMLDLFATRPEHDVGGWAVPYVLSPLGPSFCSYAYSVSDPIFDQIAPRSIIPHGTSEAGGASLSVTALENNEGLAVYWLQLPGGALFRRTEDGYKVYRFSGGPNAFKEQVQTVLNLSVHLWFSDHPVGPVKRLMIMNDADGQPSMAIADHGNGLSMSVLNVATPFQSGAQMTFREDAEPSPFNISVANDKMTATVRVCSEGSPETTLTLTAQEIDTLIKGLSRARFDMAVPQPAEPKGQSIDFQADPAWRTRHSPHPSLPGILLYLRHGGIGWQGFMLPYHEAQALGDWLVNNSRP